MEESKCTVCLKYISNEVYQCWEGHILCKSCEWKLDYCPVCKVLLPKCPSIRNRALENLIDQLKFPCNFKKLGCSARLMPRKKNKHENLCEYRTLQACQHFGLDCREDVIFSDILQHLKTHDIGSATKLRNSRVLLSQRFVSKTNFMEPFSYKHKAWVMHDHVFCLNTNLDGNNTIEWVIKCLTNSQSPAFEYNIKATMQKRVSVFNWQGQLVPTFPNVSQCKIKLHLSEISKTQNNIEVEGSQKVLNWVLEIQIHSKASVDFIHDKQI